MNEEIRAKTLEEASIQLDAITIAIDKARAKGDEKTRADLEIIANAAEKVKARIRIEDTRPQPYSLRLEPETRAKLEAIAKANGRSLNTQIVIMLESQMQSEEVPTMNDDLENRIRQIARQEAMEVVREELLSKAIKKSLND